MPEKPHDLIQGSGAEPTFLPVLLPPVSLGIQRVQVALGLLRSVVQEASSQYWYDLGKAAREAGDWEKAMYAFGQCVSRDNCHWRGPLQLALVLAHQQLGEKTASALRVAYNRPYTSWLKFVNEISIAQWHLLKAEPESLKSTGQAGFNVLFGLVLVYRAVKQLDTARQTLDIMRFMHEQQVKVLPEWFRLSGSVWFDCKDWDSAIADYDRAIEIDPDNARIYTIRGNVKFSLKDYTGAVADYDRAIELDASSAWAYDSRGRSRNNSKDYAGAVADYDRAIELDPGNARAYASRGRSKNNLKDYAGAVADYDRAIELDSTLAITNHACRAYAMSHLTN